MAKANIKHVPESNYVSNLKIDRDRHTIQTSWKYKSDATKDSNDKRVENVDVSIGMFIMDVGATAKAMPNFTPKKVNLYKNPKTNQKGFSYTAADIFKCFGSGTVTSFNKKFDRSRYYPVKKILVGSVEVEITPRNSKGVAKESIVKYYNFKKPLKPTAKITFNKDTKVATVTVTTPKDSGAHERYDTMVRIKINTALKENVTLLKWTSTKSLSYTKAYDLSEYLPDLIQHKDNITLTCEAYARGLNGDSDIDTAAFSLGYPQPAAIKSIKLVDTYGNEQDAYSGTNRSSIKILYGCGAYTRKLQLQRSHAGSGDWTDVGNQVDNSGKTEQAFFDSYGDAEPVPGEYIYYRIQSINGDYSVYSSAFLASCLFTEISKAHARASQELVGYECLPDGTAVKLIFGFTDSTANIGTEFSYSMDPMDWDAANRSPEILDITSVDDTVNPKAKEKGYEKSQTITIANLAQNATYYLKARRYRYPPASSDKAYTTKYAEAKLFTKPSEDSKNKCGIIKVEEGDLDQIHGIYVTVGITETVGNTGTELSWSESKSAWSSSNIGYSSFEYDATPSVLPDNDPMKNIWDKYVTLFIADLDSGKTYYIRSRRIKDAGGSDKTYGPYSDIFTRSMLTAEDDEVSINPVPLSGGTVIRLDITINEDNPNTGTEIQWSDYETAWESNISPDTMNADWLPDSNGVQVAYIRNLEPDTQYWIRARRYLISGQTTTYGSWCETQTFITSRNTAANDICEIITVIGDSAGTGAIVTIGYTEDSANIATELSWSTDPNAWESNKTPETLDVDWKDEESRSEDYKATQVVYVRGLELNKTYYFKARRYNEDSRGRTWSLYSTTMVLTTPSKSENFDIRCGLISAIPMNDGHSVEMIVGWEGDHTGCEISYSDDIRAWRSSNEPSVFNFDWEDAENQSGTYIKTTDTAIDPTKNYYALVNNVYELVENPVAEELENYYEFTYLWGHTGTCYVDDLVEGTLYYMRVRSYYEGDNGTAYSDYTEDVTVIPISAPNSVILSSYESIFKGDPIECWWSVESEMEQTEWHMYSVDVSVDPPVYNTLTAIALGEGSLCRGVIPPEVYGDSSTFSFCVEVSCGGGFTISDPITVGIVTMPKFDLYVPEIVQSQPVDFKIYTDILDTRFLASCYSKGIVTEYPDKRREQYENDSIWTYSGNPLWTATTWGETDLYAQLLSDYESAGRAADDAREAFHQLPEWDALEEAIETLYSIPEGDPGYEEALSEYEAAYDAAYSTEEGMASANADQDYEEALDILNNHPEDDPIYEASSQMTISDLWDSCDYDLIVRPVESMYSNVGDAVAKTFNVSYSHEAPLPSENIAIVPNISERSVTITLAPPENALSTDVYDIYRMTPESFELVASGMDLDDVVVDPYAPYGHANLAYRICTRTVDGSINWMDYPYEMKVYCLRFDWATNNSVELPWNIGLSKTYKKEFEARAKLGGDVHGRWDPAVTKSGGYTTDIIRVSDSDLLRQLENMANYPGSVWVRDGYGQAMECDAELSNVQIDNLSMIVSLSIDITQVKMTEEFYAARYVDIAEEQEP